MYLLQLSLFLLCGCGQNNLLETIKKNTQRNNSEYKKIYQNNTLAKNIYANDEQKKSIYMIIDKY